MRGKHKVLVRVWQSLFKVCSNKEDQKFMTGLGDIYIYMYIIYYIYVYICQPGLHETLSQKQQQTYKRKIKENKRNKKQPKQKRNPSNFKLEVCISTPSSIIKSTVKHVLTPGHLLQDRSLHICLLILTANGGSNCLSCLRGGVSLVISSPLT